MNGSAVIVDEIQMMPFKRAMELEGKGFVEVIYKDE